MDYIPQQPLWGIIIRMTLPKKAIEEYKQIYKKQFGEELTDAEAQEQATNLIEFFELLIAIDKKKPQNKETVKKP